MDDAIRHGHYHRHCQARRGVPAVVHSYYTAADEDPTPHVAGFLLARSEQWYYLGSTGWCDGRATRAVLAAAGWPGLPTARGALALAHTTDLRAPEQRLGHVKCPPARSVRPRNLSGAPLEPLVSPQIAVFGPSRWDSSYRWSSLYDSCGRCGRYRPPPFALWPRRGRGRWPSRVNCVHTAYARRAHGVHTACTRRAHGVHTACTYTRPVHGICRCGRPLGPTVGEVMLTRAFEGCHIMLDCANVSACVGNISFSHG